MSICDVIVPCYRYGHFLRECVTSVLSQSFKDVRVVVINDASPDDTAAVADALVGNDARVTVIHHEVNRGHIASYNEALARSTAEFSLILSADDVLTEGALERAIRAFRAYPSAGLCYGNDIPFTTDGSRRPPVTTGCTEYIDYLTFVERSSILGHTPIQAPTAFTRASIQHHVGGFLPSLPHSGDTEIWLRIAAVGGVVQLSADQAYRRLHTTNMSLDYTALQRLQEQERAFRMHFDTLQRPVPGVERFKANVARAVGEKAFWLAVRAFEQGSGRNATEALDYSLQTCPALRRTRPYRRFMLKRTLGRRLSTAITPLVSVFHRRDAAIENSGGAAAEQTVGHQSTQQTARR